MATISEGYGNTHVHKYFPDGKLLFSWGKPGTDPGQFHSVHHTHWGHGSRSRLLRASVGAVEGKIIRADGRGDAARGRSDALPSQRDSDFDAIRMGLYEYGWAALRETRRCRAQGERRCGKERDRIY
jgi:hypothetical protein